MLLLSPSDRQSGELAAKVFGYYGALGQPIGSRKRTELQLHLVNGGRVIALPKNEKTIRGFLGARLLVVDETSRVSDALYPAVRPMLAVSRGRHQPPNAVVDDGGTALRRFGGQSAGARKFLRSSARSRRRFACAGRCVLSALAISLCARRSM